MTSKDSICIRCTYLWPTRAICISGGEMSLVSDCELICGKNKGNRKTCKGFSAAKDKVINDRMSLFEEAERRADHEGVH